MNQVYSKVYHIVNQNYQNFTGENLPFSECTYLANSMIPPNICDVSKLPTESHKDFIHGLYTVVYNHLMSEEASIYWEKKASETPDKINDLYLYSVLDSLEYKEYKLRAITNYENVIGIRIYKKKFTIHFLFGRIFLHVAITLSKVSLFKKIWHKISKKNRNKITHFFWGVK